MATARTPLLPEQIDDERDNYTPVYNENERLFHKSVWYRVIMGITVCGQIALIGIFCSQIASSPPFYSVVANILFRHLSFLYFYPLLYSFGIWILCIIYNRPLPRTKLFLITELVKLAPGYAVILGAIGLEIYYWATEDDYLIHFILFVELMVLIVAIYVYVFPTVYFLQHRRKELMDLLSIERKDTLDPEDPESDPQYSGGETSRANNEGDLLSRDDFPFLQR